MKSKAQIGTLLYELRTEAGLTQADLSSRIAVSVPVISRTESGLKDPPTTRFVHWVEACDHQVQVVGRDRPLVNLRHLSTEDADLIENLIAVWPDLHPEVRASFQAQLRLWKKVVPSQGGDVEVKVG
jgi:transcriptional regulator with XRE-family HTH domain